MVLVGVVLLNFDGSLYIKIHEVFCLRKKIVLFVFKSFPESVEFILR